MTHQVSNNVRFLLWDKKIPRTGWEAWLVKANIPSAMSKRLIQGTLTDDKIESGQMRAIAEAMGLDEESLRSVHLPQARADVLLENLRFLIGTLGHGGKKSLAAKLDIDPTTVSRWLRGGYEPQPASLSQIVSEFGLQPGTDLLKDPVFLSAEPISVVERKEWLNKRIDALSPEELRELFPALRRLLEER